MTNVFHDFLIEVVNRIDGTDEEKTDIYEELLTHLELTRDQYINEGMNQEEAEQLAMDHFGNSKTIGNEMQEAMFPLRRLFLLILSLLSIVYAAAVYIVYLMNEVDAEMVWLVLSMSTSSGLLLFALQAFPATDRKRWINTVLIVHSFVYLVGILLAADIDHSLSIFLSISCFFIFLFSIFLIYRTTIIDFNYETIELSKQKKQLHFLNISTGIVVTGATLFFLWMGLIFTGSIPPFILVTMIPLFLWIVLYIIQIQLVNHKKKKTAYVIAIIPFSMLVFILVFFVWNAIPKGVSM